MYFAPLSRFKVAIEHWMNFIHPTFDKFF